MKIDNTKFAQEYVETQLSGCEPNEQYIIFEALIRRKDNVNPVFTNAHGDSLLLRAWYVDTPSKLEKYLPEMRYLCALTGARLYMSLDTKSTRGFSIAFAKEVHEITLNMLRGNQISVKNTIKMPLSVLASKSSSVHNKRKILIDVDEPQEDICHRAVNSIIERIPTGVPYYLLKSANGAHVIIDRTGLNVACFIVNLATIEENFEYTIKENAMTVVYFNNEDVISEIN